MYKLIGCNHNDKILDAACGSAGFLVKAMNFMINEAPSKRVEIQTQQLFGVE
jgi:type I restriction-modification system DNA methylase subunit